MQSLRHIHFPASPSPSLSPLSTSSEHTHSPFGPVALVACIPSRFDNVLRSVKIIRSAIEAGSATYHSSAFVISGELESRRIVAMEHAMRRCRTCTGESSLTLENTGARDTVHSLPRRSIVNIDHYRPEHTLLRHNSLQ